MDIDGFKSALFLLPYSPLEPMVINFTCDFHWYAFRRADPPWSSLYVLLKKIKLN